MEPIQPFVVLAQMGLGFAVLAVVIVMQWRRRNGNGNGAARNFVRDADSGDTYFRVSLDRQLAEIRDEVRELSEWMARYESAHERAAIDRHNAVMGSQKHMTELINLYQIANENRAAQLKPPHVA